jgi:hypothetical protein
LVVLLHEDQLLPNTVELDVVGRPFRSQLLQKAVLLQNDGLKACSLVPETVDFGEFSLEPADLLGKFAGILLEL